MKTLQEIEARLAEINTELNTRGKDLTAEQLTALETEVQQLEEQRTALRDAETRRQGLLERIAKGQGTSTPAVPVAPAARTAAAAAENDAHDTVEYRKAFMNYVCRGVEIPMELRAAETTTTANAGAVVPTSLLNEIITKLESYGGLFTKVRKLNVQGGVSIPIVDLKPTAHWIADGAASDDQKVGSDKDVTFNYYGLECKIAQSILSNVVSLQAFNDLFIPLATEAMMKAIEIAIIKGTGSGQPLGVSVDPRIITDLAASNVITLTPAEMKTWAGWHTKVKAKIKKAYQNGEFIMAQGTYDGYIDGMVDTNGQPVARTNYGIDGVETYRFMGKLVDTVEADVIADYDSAATGDVIAVYMNPADYVINSNMEMTATKWTDNDTNKIKNKLLMICDGKAADVNGMLIIKKGATA